MSSGKIQNSYLYYNLLGLFWRVGDSTASVIYIFTLLGCLSLLAGFEIGRQIGGKWLGLSCLLALAVNTYIAHYQISVYQRSILPSAALVLVVLSISAIKKRSFLSLFLLHSFFLFSLLLHYSMATLIIPLAVITLIALHTNKAAFKQKVFYVLGTAIGALVLFLILTGIDLTQATSFFFSTQKSTVWQEENVSLQDTLIYHAKDISKLFGFVFSLSQGSSITAVVWTGLVSAAAYVALGNRQFRIATLVYLYMFSYLFLHVLDLQISYPNFFQYDYMQHYAALIVLLVPISAYILVKRFIPRSIPYTLGLVCCAFLILEGPRVVAMLTNQLDIYQNDYERYQRAARTIMNDIENGQVKQRTFAVTDYSLWAKPGWFSPSLLFFMEEEMDTSFATLKKDFNNLNYTFAHPAQDIYLLCNHFVRKEVPSTVATAKTDCVDKFFRDHLSNYTSLPI